jgi:hypothetical protein
VRLETQGRLKVGGSCHKGGGLMSIVKAKWLHMMVQKAFDGGQDDEAARFYHRRSV